MKKFFISLNLLILAYFFAINPSYCEEDFFMNSEFKEAKNKSKVSQEVNKKLKKAKGIKKEKAGFFSKFKKEKSNEEKKGYYGTLPNISRDFEYKRQTTNTTSEIEAKVPTDDDLNNENLKRAPFDDSLFLDVVIKKEKMSDYIKDIQKTKFALNNLKKCIEEQGDIQRFNGCVNVINLYVQNLKTKYNDKSESLKESYIEILSTNYQAKVLGNLMFDANYYSRLVPTSQGKYSDNNIKNQKEDLLNKINKTIFLINNES